MKQATVADLRNRFRRVSAWLANGEEVEIIRRGRPFARLRSTAQPTLSSIKVDFAAQRNALWKGRSFSSAQVSAMRAAERAGEEG